MRVNSFHVEITLEKEEYDLLVDELKDDDATPVLAYTLMSYSAMGVTAPTYSITCNNNETLQRVLEIL